MTSSIPINLVVEDPLSEAVLQRILREVNAGFVTGSCFCGGGYGYIKHKILGFNNAAKGTPFIVLADLEEECPPVQIRHWLPVPMHPNLLLRIAVKEVESWLLADRDGLSSFLGVSGSLMPQNSDNVGDPKRFLIDLARRSRKRMLRESIVPRTGSTARVGPDYNGALSRFVNIEWNVERAIKNSDSLKRAVHSVNNFQPKWT